MVYLNHKIPTERYVLSLWPQCRFPLHAFICNDRRPCNNKGVTKNPSGKKSPPSFTSAFSTQMGNYCWRPCDPYADGLTVEYHMEMCRVYKASILYSVSLGICSGPQHTIFCLDYCSRGNLINYWLYYPGSDTHETRPLRPQQV